MKKILMSLIFCGLTCVSYYSFAAQNTSPNANAPQQPQTQHPNPNSQPSTPPNSDKPDLGINGDGEC